MRIEMRKDSPWRPMIGWILVLGAVVLAVPGCGDSDGGSGGAAGVALTGRVDDPAGAPLSGVLVTAFDDVIVKSTSVFTDGNGRYRFPPLEARRVRVRARRIGFDDASRPEIDLTPGKTPPSVDLQLSPRSDVNDQLPASSFYALLDWPDARVKGDFSRACANCHQIGNHEFTEARSADEWHEIFARMTAYGAVPFFDETRPVLLPTLLRTFGPGAKIPSLPAPPPPSGDATRVVLTEWEIDPVDKPDCHDLELDPDGVVYTVGGMYSIDTRTGARAKIPVPGGGHSVERAPDGSMWITAPGPETLVRFDPETGEAVPHVHPRIGEDLGSYPHTLRVDPNGVIWETLTRSNHVARFDPATGEFRYFRLPPADPEISGVPIAVAYGLDLAPDGGVWWSQLFGHRIGRIDPVTGEVKSWRPPFLGPRRLAVGPDGQVWVPGYGSSQLGRFDPTTETWKVWDLPTRPRGSELPYTVNVEPRTGDVWITGSNSDTLIRFRPSTEQWTIFPLPTPVDFTREIEFDADGAIWTCTSKGEIGPGIPGTGRLVRLQLLSRDGACGDGTIQVGEQCDDGNDVSCDGCSADCLIETGCGDGVSCGAETCDDGNTDSCDGCSASCTAEVGAFCGDGAVNESCGEECDPPGTGCTAECRRAAYCGDGRLDPGEACDDANSRGCDGCSAACRIDAGCGDGDLCAGETCDDGNSDSCDGCSAQCTVESGYVCGDGVLATACGEECDPPGTGCSPSCRVGSELGIRHVSVGGHFYSSALGPTTPLGDLTGEIDIAAGELGAVGGPGSGAAPLRVDGPTWISAAILGGTFGTYCVRIDACTGWIDCDGGTPADVRTVLDSQGAGKQGRTPVITTGIGRAAGPGAVNLTCDQAFVQLEPGVPTGCRDVEYPAPASVVYTTGTAESYVTNGNTKVGTGTLTLTGEAFSCAQWNHENGPGALVGGFLVEDDPRAGDLANVNRIED